MAKKLTNAEQLTWEILKTPAESNHYKDFIMDLMVSELTKKEPNYDTIDKLAKELT